MSQRHLPNTVALLHKMAQDPNPIVSTWALHSLCVTINNAGKFTKTQQPPTNQYYPVHKHTDITSDAGYFFINVI